MFSNFQCSLTSTVLSHPLFYLTHCSLTLFSNLHSVLRENSSLRQFSLVHCSLSVRENTVLSRPQFSLETVLSQRLFSRELFSNETVLSHPLFSLTHCSLTNTGSLENSSLDIHWVRETHWVRENCSLTPTVLWERQFSETSTVLSRPLFSLEHCSLTSTVL